MEIKKCSDFINERHEDNLINPLRDFKSSGRNNTGKYGLYTRTAPSDSMNHVLDYLIDQDGNRLSIAGHIVKPKKDYYKIVDEDWINDLELLKLINATTDVKKQEQIIRKNIEHEYIGGIDKNGDLVGLEFSTGGLLLNKKDNVLTNWIKGSNHSNLTSHKSATGWVNVKIDMELARKVRRFSKKLSTKKGHAGLIKRLSILENIKNIPKGDYADVLQSKISTIMLLQFLKEGKEHFNPTSWGFLFESYIAGLIGEAKALDDNTGIDIKSDDNESYQLKFYDWDGGDIDIIKDGNIVCDYYIICLKDRSKINMWIFERNDIQTMIDNNELTTSTKHTKQGISNAKLRKTSPDFVIDLAHLDDKIDIISVGLKDTLNVMWTSISELQYNVETLLTGVDKNHKKIKGKDDLYDMHYREANKNIVSISKELNKFEIRDNIKDRLTPPNV